MVHSIRTNSINRGRGRGRGRGANGQRVPGVPYREMLDSRHTSTTSSQNRIPVGNRSPSVRSNPTQGSGRDRSPVAPLPTQAELEEKIESLNRTKEELKNQLAYTKWDSDRTVRMLHNLQVASVRKGNRDGDFARREKYPAWGKGSFEDDTGARKADRRPSLARPSAGQDEVL